LLAVILGMVGLRKTRDGAAHGRGLAVAGIVLGLVSLCGWGVIGGGVLYSYVRSQPARAVADQFLADVSSGDIASAHAKCTELIGGDSVESGAALFAHRGTLQGTTVTKYHYTSRLGGDVVEPTGTATFTGARVNFWFHLIKRSGAFKVDGMAFGDSVTPSGNPLPSSAATSQRL
jgi:hypothetical protein